MSITSVEAINKYGIKPKFALVRIIGNDLPPRHGKGQSYKNIKFILENEQNHENCSRYWVINKIFDPLVERKIIALLDSYNEKYTTIPIDLENYDKNWPTWKKNTHLIGINYARNVAINEGIALGADWIFPFDGNIFMTEKGFKQIKESIMEHDCTNLIYPVRMFRLLNNKYVNEVPTKINWEEPQVALHKSCLIRFNETLEWGFNDKYYMVPQLRKVPNLDHVVRLSDYTPKGYLLPQRKKTRADALNLFYQNANKLKLKMDGAVKPSRKKKSPKPTNNWTICYSRSDLTSETDKIMANLSKNNTKTLSAPRLGDFYADPFVITYQDKPYLFLEHYIGKTKKGILSYFTLDPTTLDPIEPEPVQILKNIPYHLSFPFIFKDKTSQIYMIPETHKTKKIQLYKAQSFPDDWVLQSVLIDNIDCSDTTIFWHDGYYWLFTSVFKTKSKNDKDKGNGSKGGNGKGSKGGNGKNKGKGNRHSNLTIYYCKTLEGTWKKHPVEINDTKARNAGRIFIYNDLIIRPSQDCSRFYGERIMFNQILELDPKNYHEIPLGNLNPWSSDLIGVHTYNHDEESKIIVVDAMHTFSKNTFSKKDTFSKKVLPKTVLTENDTHTFEKVVLPKTVKKRYGFMATMPERKNNLEKIIKVFENKFECLQIYCNYPANEPIPDFLLNKAWIKPIHSAYNEVGNLKAKGKIFGVEKVKEGLVFLLDDDLVYPNSYIDDMTRKIEQYNNRCVVTVHGGILSPTVKEFYKERNKYYFKASQPKDRIINLVGTGVCAFDAESVNILLDDFKTNSSIDLWFSIQCQFQKVPIVCVKHPKDYIVDIKYENSLWSDRKTLASEQNHIAKCINWRTYTF